MDLSHAARESSSGMGGVQVATATPVNRARSIQAVSMMLGSNASRGLVRVITHFIGDRRAEAMNPGLITVCASGSSEHVRHDAHRQAFRWAWDNLLTQTERNILISDFSPGSRLAHDVARLVSGEGVVGGVSSPRDVAGHAYALYVRKKLDLSAYRSAGIMSGFRETVRAANAFFWRVVEGHEHTQPDVERLFQELSTGKWIDRLPDCLRSAPVSSQLEDEGVHRPDGLPVPR